MATNVEEMEIKGGRKPFTKGWNDHLNTSYALPIKKSGQIIQVSRTIPNRKEEYTSDDDEDNDTTHDDDNHDDNGDDKNEYENFDENIQTHRNKKVKTKTSSTSLSIDDQETMQELIKPIPQHEFNRIQMILAEICTTICADPQQALKRKKSDDNSSSSSSSSSISNKKKMKKAVYALPELATPSDSYRLSDLFQLIRHANYRVKEMTILSTLLVFKDIIPGYAIREDQLQTAASSSLSSESKKIILKKDTKQIIDFERSLLTSYRQFLNILESWIQDGLNQSREKGSESSDKNQSKDIGSSDNDNDKMRVLHHLGFIALKCQCELLRAVPHFNYRSQLISSIVNHAAAQSNTTATTTTTTATTTATTTTATTIATITTTTESISHLCCTALIQTIESDIEGEYSYEILRAIARILEVTKYHIPERLLYVLEKIKVRIHEDESKSIRKQAKKDKKKRKNDNEDIESNLLESSGVNQVLVKRQQADSLKELVFIYFRILKNKIGFKLLPVALEGLARLTHLINMDTVMDLLAILKKLLLATGPVTPLNVRLHCIFCALRTLSGAGETLEMDGEIFLQSLCAVLSEIGGSGATGSSGTGSIDRWDLILECIDLCLIKKRETRKYYIIEILRLLILQIVYQASSTSILVTSTILSLCHNILIHYPVIRSDIINSLYRIKQLGNTSSSSGSSGGVNIEEEEEEVQDLAMAPLLKNMPNQLKNSSTSSGSSNSSNSTHDHIFWSLPILYRLPGVCCGAPAVTATATAATTSGAVAAAAVATSVMKGGKHHGSTQQKKTSKQPPAVPLAAVVAVAFSRSPISSEGSRLKELVNIISGTNIMPIQYNIADIRSSFTTAVSLKPHHKQQHQSSIPTTAITVSGAVSGAYRMLIDNIESSLDAVNPMNVMVKNNTKTSDTRATGVSGTSGTSGGNSKSNATNKHARSNTHTHTHTHEFKNKKPRIDTPASTSTKGGNGSSSGSGIGSKKGTSTGNNSNNYSSGSSSSSSSRGKKMNNKSSSQRSVSGSSSSKNSKNSKKTSFTSSKKKKY